MDKRISSLGDFNPYNVMEKRGDDKRRSQVLVDGSSSKKSGNISPYLLIKLEKTAS